ncbi:MULTISPECIES: NAD(P)/FAD-dependent oxidoreductase [Vibrio]|uniref:NAD(P)/FAD-dependent oxidoreductase n=1 Tax=Vibrio kanaloae TaxID=170673 RepID=A0ABV4LH06_9VIBR|nr:FAD-binding oxidoreductase [Vibrio kanaloae]OEF12959.1 gamma-glutamylputrescine oxidoreductase [Vibrio kanaloae 5S-149]TKE98603.1 FAD-binding oxidoreductase [Vibrio kanaloae]TKF60272.1 FAD-binding oxidoreductase [Vibrio kanaloae]
MNKHTDSFYAHSIPNMPEFPQLQGNIECDVCVVGAGFSGLSSALHLAEKGFKVVVLESAKVGFGATGRNGGQIVNSYSRDVDVIESRYDQPHAKALCDMIFEGGDVIRGLIEKYDIECDHKRGGLFTALNKKQLKGLEHHKKNWERYGNDQLTMLDASQVEEAVGTQVYTGGLLDMRGGHIHPLKLALGEAAAFVSLGGQIFEQSAVTSIEKGANPVARTASGSVKSKYLVLAGNAYLGGLAPNISNKAIPCGTQVVATEPLTDEQLKQVLPSDYCVEDCNYLLDYFRLSADKRLLFGGGVVYGARDPQDIESLIRPKLEGIFPQLKGIKIDYTWTGNFLLTYSRMPQFGAFDDNIYYLQGYSGHGVTCTHLAGKLLAEALTGHAERFDAFAQLKHYAFPGGRHFQIPFTAVGAAYYNLRDKLAI